MIKNRLITTRLLLSKVAITDAEWLFNLIQENKRYLADRFPWVNNISSLQKEEDMIKYLIKKWEYKKSYCFSMKENSDQIGMGMVSAIEIDEMQSMCELGYWISEKYQSKGYVKEAVSAIEEELFKIGLKRIYLKMDSDNCKSIMLALRSNYSLYSIEKGNFFVNDSKKDTLVFCKVMS